MSSNIFSRILNLLLDSIVTRTMLATIRTLFGYLISLLSVEIPKVCFYVLELGKTDEKSEKQKRIRAKLVDDDDPSSPYRPVEALDKLQSELEKNVETLAVIPDLCLKRYADKETMGIREILDIEDEKQSNGKTYKKFILGDYKFTTYREACARIVNIGRGLLSFNAKLGDKILIFSETRPEWLLTAFATFRHGLTLVTLSPTLGEEAIKHAINESQVEIVITSQEFISKLEKILNQTKKVKYVIYFPALAKVQQATITKDNDNVQWIPLTKLEEQGNNAYIDEEILKRRPEKHDIAVIMYTSGSTGIPKGVLITHENVIAAMTGQKERVFPIIDANNDIYIAYLPLAHILELSSEILVFFMGIKCGYSTPQTLTDQSSAIKQGQKGDLQVLRPHLMTCVPAILDRIHKTVNKKVSQANFFKRQLYYLAYTIKFKRLEAGLDSPILDRLIFSDLNQSILGGRLKVILCGGAVLAEDTQRFFHIALCVPLFQGYGLTETCAAGTIADQLDITSGRAGYSLVSCEIRLVNWEEGHFRVTDKPNPRGEILIGGAVVAEGYFGEASKENVNFKEINGTRYFSTGDIGEVFPDGTIKIVDRKKDLVKLCNGEYVSLSKVETAISKSPLFDNCCLCASSSSEYTVVLICLNTKEIASFVKRKFNNADWKSLVNDKKFKNEILKEVQNICKRSGIDKHETPHNIKIVTDSWTPESGLVTDAFKLKRKAIEQKYKDDIEQLYENTPEQDATNKTQSNTNKEQPNTNKKDSKQNPIEVKQDMVSNTDENKKDL